MSYNKKVWKSGDRITKEALNNMENGIEAAHQNSGGTGSTAIVDNLNSDSPTSALSAKQGKELNNKIPTKSIVEGGKIYLAKKDGTKLDAGTVLPAGGSTIEVVNNLESDSTTAALSAAQGKALNTQYKDIASKIENGNIGNNVEPELMDMPRIYFSDGTLPTSKTATVMKFDYYSKTIEYHGYVDIKCQGNSSMAYPKKNFTIKPYQDKAKTKKLKIDFKGWGKQSKFVLKANWIDISHARNVVSARLWGDIIKTRGDYATALPELLRTSPNQGAIDGFPVLVYSNGVYQGRYTLNIPKDKWMSNMDDALDTHCILCGENYASGCFRALPQINGSDWTDELHDVVPATIKTSWTNAIKFVMNSSDAEFKANLSNYFDVNSLIDYYIYGLVSTNLDGFGKNQLFFCYDGIHWIASVYDLDSTWGLYWNGSRILPTDYARNQYEDYVNKTSNLLYNRLEQLYMAQLKTRYTELRKDVLSASHIIQKFEEFNDVCPKDIVQEDYASTTGGGKFTGIPSLTTNNIQQLRSNIVGRLTYVDGYINALHEAIPCTNITLNNTALTFTTEAAQTLTATVTPTDTTDKIVWSVSPSGIVTVKDGIITPISNGECVVTATCGNQSATCNVTVNLPVEAVTALSLDKDSTNLTISTVDESNINLLEGIGHDKETGDIIFNEITLSPGIYTFKNMNQGDFTYLGYYVNNTRYVDGTNNTADTTFIISKECVIKPKMHNGNSTAVDGNIGLFKTKSLNVITTSTPFVYGSNGAINSPTSTDCQTSQVVTLDTNKKYILRKATVGIIEKYLCIQTQNNVTMWKAVSDIVSDGIGLIENVNSLKISYKQDELSDIELVEIGLQAASSSIVYGTDTIIATLTPPNATNKNVTWSADNENVQLVSNGLNCTVKAKAVGDSIVTCTSQDTTNGTITDTCNVTVTDVSAT